MRNGTALPDPSPADGAVPAAHGNGNGSRDAEELVAQGLTVQALRCRKATFM